MREALLFGFTSLWIIHSELIDDSKGLQRLLLLLHTSWVEWEFEISNRFVDSFFFVFLYNFTDLCILHFQYEIESGKGAKVLILFLAWEKLVCFYLLLPLQISFISPLNLRESKPTKTNFIFFVGDYLYNIDTLPVYLKHCFKRIIVKCRVCYSFLYWTYGKPRGLITSLV